MSEPNIGINDMILVPYQFHSAYRQNKLSSASLSFHAACNPNAGHKVDFPSLLGVNHLLISPNFLVNGRANYSTSVNQSISMGSKNQGPLWASTHAEYIKWPLLKLMGQYHWIQGLVQLICSCSSRTGLWWPLWGVLLRSGNKVSVYLAGRKSWVCALEMVSLVWGRYSWFKSRPFLLYVDAVNFGKCINRQMCTNRGQREGIPLLPLFKPKHTGVLSGSQTL